MAKETWNFSYEDKKWLQVEQVFVTINDVDINLCNCFYVSSAMLSSKS